MSRRYIIRKLAIINKLRDEVKTLKREKQERDKTLRRLSAEYTLMGKECEAENMKDAAMRNYQKALELYPEASEPKRRLKKLTT